MSMPTLPFALICSRSVSVSDTAEPESGLIAMAMVAHRSLPVQLQDIVVLELVPVFRELAFCVPPCVQSVVWLPPADHPLCRPLVEAKSTTSCAVVVPLTVTDAVVLEPLAVFDAAIGVDWLTL